MKPKYTGWVVFVLKLPILPEFIGIFRLMKPFSGTKISTYSDGVRRISEVASNAYAKNTIDLPRVDFSVSLQGVFVEKLNATCLSEALSNATNSRCMEASALVI